MSRPFITWQLPHTSSKHLIAGVLTSASLLLSAAAHSQSFYVSPNGNDRNNGTQSSPFRTLERARNAVRGVNSNMRNDINVYLRGGNYPVSRTIEFDTRDSGTNANRVVYQAFNNEEPVLNGATQVTGWTRHRGDIFRATLNRSSKLRTLIVNGERAYMASKVVTANGNWGTYSIRGGQAPWARMSGSEPDGARYRLSDIPSLNNADDVEIMNQTTWNTNIVTVRGTRVEGSDRVLLFSQPYAAIAFNQRWGGFSNRGTHTLSNALEFLDEKNEFYFDRRTNTLYYHSGGINMSRATVWAPSTGELLNLNGNSRSDRIENITFSGITFANTEAVLPEVAGSAGKSTVQAATWKGAYSDENWHNDRYTAYDVMRGAVNVNNARSISFEDGRIEHAGNEGINFTNDVIGSQIVGNAIVDIGGSGINISHPQHVYIGDGGTNEKYSRVEEGVAQNILIKNNLIYDATRLYWGHAAITAFFPEGLDIQHNQIQNTHYTGVSVGWGWNNFAPEQTSNPTTVMHSNKFNNNRVFNVMTTLEDGGAYYTLGNQPNSEASRNYVRAPSSHFQGVYHPDEGTAHYTGTDLVFEVRPGQDNFELNLYRDKHDNHYRNIYTTSSSNATGAPRSSITNMSVHSAGNWPAQALAIIANSGIQQGYEHLLQGIPTPPAVPGVRGPRFPLAFAPNNENARQVRFVKRNAPGFAIDGGSGGVDGRPVELWRNVVHNNLTWTEINRGGGYYSYQKLGTNFCIDGGHGGALGQDVYLWTCSDTTHNQQWRKVDVGSGHFVLEKRNAPNFVIDGGVGGALDQNVHLWRKDLRNQNQHWKFE